MPEGVLPVGWSIEIERLANGVNSYELRQQQTTIPWSRHDGLAVDANTYPGGGAWVEYGSLAPDYGYDDAGGSGFENNESLDLAELRARAVLFGLLAADLEERDRSTSTDVLVRFPGSATAYAFECDQRAAVGDVVSVMAHRGRLEVKVVELGTGGYVGKRNGAKFVGRAASSVGTETLRGSDEGTDG